MTKIKAKQVKELTSQLQETQGKLQSAQEKEKRALADYQNLLRRQRDERLALVKMANQELVLALLHPLDNLSRAAAQLNDQGLTMVISQLWQTLEEAGLAEIEVMGKEFDVECMEVVDKKGKSEKVVEVINQGYRLNGEVVQHAKVVIG